MDKFKYEDADILERFYAEPIPVPEAIPPIKEIDIINFKRTNTDFDTFLKLPLNQEYINNKNKILSNINEQQHKSSEQ